MKTYQLFWENELIPLYNTNPHDSPTLMHNSSMIMTFGREIKGKLKLNSNRAHKKKVKCECSKASNSSSVSLEPTAVGGIILSFNFSFLGR